MRDLIRANAGLLAAGVATFVMMGAGQSLYGPALPAFGRDLGLTAPEAGWLVSTHWIGCTIGVAFMYLRGAMVTPRVVIATMGAGAGLVALGSGLVGAFLGALVFGAGYGASTVVFNPRILKVFGARGTSMLSLLNACFGIGAIAAPLMFVWLGSVPGRAFAVIAIAAVLIWLGAGVSGGGVKALPKAESGPYRPMFGLQVFAVLGIGMEACLIGLGPTALIAAGYSEAAAAQHLSAFFVAFLAARVSLVFVAHLAGPFRLFTGAMATAALSAGLAALVSPGVFFVVMGFSTGMFFPSFYVAATKVMGDDPRVAPTIIAAGLLGGIVAPILLGAGIGMLGERGFFWVMALTGLGVTGAALAAARRFPVLKASP